MTDRVVNGEPRYYETNRIYMSQCCDCGKQHLELYDITKDGRVCVIVYANEWGTREARKKLSKRQRKAIIEALGGEVK